MIFQKRGRLARALLPAFVVLIALVYGVSRLPGSEIRDALLILSASVVLVVLVALVALACSGLLHFLRKRTQKRK